MIVAATAEGVRFHSPLPRSLNVLVFFTIDSNVIMGATSLLLAMNPKRSSTLFNAARLAGVVSIAITGIVFHAVLGKLLDLESWALVADKLTHTVVPIMGVLGWLLYGPRGMTSRRIVRLAVIYPLVWLTFTLIRGAIIDFYPYPFVDVTHLGYGWVVVNCVWIALLYLALASGGAALDRRLTRTTVPEGGVPPRP
jgi:hypothetical protein